MAPGLEEAQAPVRLEAEEQQRRRDGAEAAQGMRSREAVVEEQQQRQEGEEGASLWTGEVVGDGDGGREGWEDNAAAAVV